jgi:hypothetical protein
VGATSKNNQRASYSHYGTGLDIVAPGDSIFSTILNNLYNALPGTSFAAPQVAGVVALMLSVNPDLTPSQIKNALTSTCTKLSGYSYNNGWNSEVGYGLLNAFAAVLSVMDFEIEGPQLISTYGQYYIDNLPSGVTVTWSLSDSNYNDNTHIISNFPATGYCLIFRDEDEDMMDATLTAEIKYNGVTIQTLTKAGIYAYEGFKGHYTSGSLSGDIPYSMIIPVTPNSGTIINSPNLIGATVSYNTTSTTPNYWAHNSSSGEIVVIMPTNNNGIPIVFNIEDGCGDQYTLYLYAQSSYNINISNDENDITVTLNEDGAPDRGSLFNPPWTIEITNASTGALMATQSSTSRSSTISTAGWPKGLYIVKVTIGMKVLIEKIIIK